MLPLIWERSAVKSPNIEPNLTSFWKLVSSGSEGVLGPLDLSLNLVSLDIIIVLKEIKDNLLNWNKKKLKKIKEWVL